MIPYCDSPRQSIGIGVIVGVISGMIALYTSEILVVFVLAPILAIIAEIIIHEYRQDEQYCNAKQSLRQTLSK